MCNDHFKKHKNNEFSFITFSELQDFGNQIEQNSIYDVSSELSKIREYLAEFEEFDKTEADDVINEQEKNPNNAKNTKINRFTNTETFAQTKCNTATMGFSVRNMFNEF